MRATINYDYLRPLKAKNLKERHESKFEKKDELSVWSGKNATILPLRSDPEGKMLFGKGGVVDENGNYVDISAINGRVQGEYAVSNPLYKDEKVVYCGYLVNHWGHFLVEAMSRLWYFLEDDKTVDKYVFFMEDGSEREIKGNYKEALVLLNIWDKLEIINKPTKYKEVVVPELGYKWKTYYSEKQKNVFETIFKNVKPNSSWKKYEKIYFTRKQLSKAGNLEFGGEVLDDFFEKNGYEVISPEKMTLSEMIFCIRNAEVCATLSGSLPHNLLFAQDGKKLIIVERCVLNNEI